MSTEANETKSYSYVGRAACGCILAARVDTGRRADVAADIAEFIICGLTVERVDSEVVRLEYGNCTHGGKEWDKEKYPPVKSITYHANGQTTIKFERSYDDDDDWDDDDDDLDEWLGDDDDFDGHEELTEEELEALACAERQREYLRRRYGTPEPASIVDYWVKDAVAS